VQNVRSSTV